MPGFSITIIGSNVSPAKAYAPGGVVFVADTSGRISGPVLINGERAIVSTREEADAIGLACRWANQRYRVIGAKHGEAVNARVTGDLVSCSS